MGVNRYHNGSWIPYRPVHNYGANTVPNILAKRVWRSVIEWQGPPEGGGYEQRWVLVADYMPPDQQVINPGLSLGGDLTTVELYGHWQQIPNMDDLRYGWAVNVQVFSNLTNQQIEWVTVPQHVGITDPIYADGLTHGSSYRAVMWYQNLSGNGPAVTVYT
jgi:hypothetical protein